LLDEAHTLASRRAHRPTRERVPDPDRQTLDDAPARALALAPRLHRSADPHPRTLERDLNLATGQVTPLPDLGAQGCATAAGARLKPARNSQPDPTRATNTTSTPALRQSTTRTGPRIN